MHHVLIIGTGYLGARLAQSLQQDGEEVLATKTTPVPECIQLDVNEPDTWTALEHVPADVACHVYCLIPPSRIDVAVFPKFVACLAGVSIQRAVLSSSSVVYGSGDREVNADSPVGIESRRGERQYQIENIWCNAGEQFRIIRLAGLYGPERIIGARSLRAEEPLNSSGSGYLNLLHIDDAVTAVRAMMESEQTNAVELACDDMPVKRSDYYAEVARLLAVPAPVFAKSEQGSMRRCNNEATCSRLNWRPRYRNYQQGLRQAIKAE